MSFSSSIFFESDIAFMIESREQGYVHALPSRVHVPLLPLLLSRLDVNPQRSWRPDKPWPDVEYGVFMVKKKKQFLGSEQTISSSCQLYHILVHTWHSVKSELPVN